jgi:hypothetical protein
MTGDGLTVTAVFDKPATPGGPTFEETLLVTPSQLPGPVLASAFATAGQAARALGLTRGPVHAELRFPGGRTLEELILASALGQPVPAASRALDQAAGCICFPSRARACCAASKAGTAPLPYPGSPA